jgi:hypothetical protein
MTILTPRQHVELTAQTLFKGESVRTVCPKCNGGSSGEKSFLCSRDHGGIILYKCFRATCGYRGKFILGDSESGYIPRTRKLHSFTRDLEELGPAQVDWWRWKFQINPGQDVYWCPSLKRDAIRVYGPQGQHRGWVLRDWTGQEPNKSISYPERDEPFIGWYKFDRKTPVVVVEDLISARKVCDAGFTGVALNGTTFNWEIAFEINEHYKEIELALDSGTMKQMVEYRELFSTIFDKIRIWTLKDDLKYVPRDRIRDAVLDGKVNFLEIP